MYWLLDQTTVLDLRISCQGLIAVCGDDVSAKANIDYAKEWLEECYLWDYHCSPWPLPMTTSQPSAALSNTSPQKVNFISRYKQCAPPTWNEVEEFFKLPQEDFETCDPLKWWAGCAAQFPDLSKYARDLFGTPGLWAYLSIQIHSTDCLLKGLLLLLSVYSLEEGTQSLYDALICSLRQFAHLCLWSDASGLLAMPSLKLLVTRTVYFDIVHLIGKFCVLY